VPTKEEYRQILREELMRVKSEGKAEAGDLGGDDGTNVSAEERNS
jgi:hypothetical protein